MAAESPSTVTTKATLRSNAIGLPGVLFQSITTMAPASAVAFSLGAAIPYAGGALPLTVLIALIVCSLIALNIGSLAKYLPSAGGYFTKGECASLGMKRRPLLLTHVPDWSTLKAAFHLVQTRWLVLSQSNHVWAFQGKPLP